MRGSQGVAAPAWIDATPFLGRVCEAMAVGELLHGDSFSLFDCTTAIEIGDVKMDIGMHRDAEDGGGSAEEMVEGGAAPVALAPPLLLALMDSLLCLEATWHNGSMLPQTVFASLYMLLPERCDTLLCKLQPGSQHCRLLSYYLTAAPAHSHLNLPTPHPLPTLHLHRLAHNAPLHAYCLGLRSACSVCVDMAHAGCVTEV